MLENKAIKTKKRGEDHVPWRKRGGGGEEGGGVVGNLNINNYDIL